MWEELLEEVVIIKWGVVCMAFSTWGLAMYFLLKEIPTWWHSFDKKEEKKKEPFTLEKMKKDLEKSTRPRTERSKSVWD